jgi:hypothetical protein
MGPDGDPFVLLARRMTGIVAQFFRVNILLKNLIAGTSFV